MVYRGGSPGRQDDGHCMAVARRSPIWPIRESSPQRTPTFLLWRSRRTTGWVRAVPGAPPTAPASMGGPDGRSDGIPGKGKGLNRVTMDLFIVASFDLKFFFYFSTSILFCFTLAVFPCTSYHHHRCDAGCTPRSDRARLVRVARTARSNSSITRVSTVV